MGKGFFQRDESLVTHWKGLGGRNPESVWTAEAVRESVYPCIRIYLQFTSQPLDVSDYCAQLQAGSVSCKQRRRKGLRRGVQGFLATSPLTFAVLAKYSPFKTFTMLHIRAIPIFHIYKLPYHNRSTHDFLQQIKQVSDST